MNAWIKSRTVWFGLAVTILSTIQAGISTMVTDPKTVGIVGVVIGITIIVLRFLTTDPIVPQQ